MFFKKDPIKTLEKEYARKMEEYRALSQQGDRKKSDLAYAEAEELMNKIVDLKNKKEN